MIWNEALVRVIVATALVVAVAAIVVFFVWCAVLDRRYDNAEETTDIQDSDPVWLWWVSALCVVVVIVIMTVSRPPVGYNRDGSITIDPWKHAWIDHIERDGSVTTCVNDEAVPAPEGHRCQDFGH